MGSVKALAILALVLLTGCASNSVPRDQTNACSIFKQKRGWYDATADAAEKYGISEGTILAFIRQESSFVHDARPPRKKSCLCFLGPVYPVPLATRRPKLILGENTLGKPIGVRIVITTVTPLTLWLGITRAVRAVSGFPNAILSISTMPITRG